MFNIIARHELTLGIKQLKGYINDTAGIEGWRGAKVSDLASMIEGALDSKKLNLFCTLTVQIKEPKQHNHIKTIHFNGIVSTYQTCTVVLVNGLRKMVDFKELFELVDDQISGPVADKIIIHPTLVDAVKRTQSLWGTKATTRRLVNEVLSKNNSGASITTGQVSFVMPNYSVKLRVQNGMDVIEVSDAQGFKSLISFETLCSMIYN